MTPIQRHRRIARVAARRSAEQGLTLIELLLSLAILAILTGFLAGGLSMARQALAPIAPARSEVRPVRRSRPSLPWWGRRCRSGLTGRARKTPSGLTVAARRSPLSG